MSEFPRTRETSEFLLFNVQSYLDSSSTCSLKHWSTSTVQGETKSSKLGADDLHQTWDLLPMVADDGHVVQQFQASQWFPDPCLRLAQKSRKVFRKYKKREMAHIKGAILYPFPQVKTVPWSLNKMYLTCFGQNTTRIKHHRSLLILSKQPYSEQLVWM